MDKPAHQEANETRLRMALKAGRMAVWDYDIANDRLNWSDGVFELFGSAPFAVTLEQFKQLIHPDDVEMVKRRFDEAAASGQPFYAELRVPQPDGSLRWAADYGSFEYDADGRPVRVIGLVQDITEQRRLRAEREESEIRLRQLIDQSPLAIQIVGTDGRTRSVNQAWQRLWGVPLEALAGYNLFEDRQLADSGILQALQRVLAGGECEPLVAGYDRGATPSVPGQSGRLTVKTRAYANRDASGAVRELVLMQEDVSQLAAAEDEVRRHREHLEDLVAQRTHESVVLQARLQSILDAIPGVAGYWDRDRICRFANEGYREWIGEPAPSLIGRRFEEVFSAEHFARVKPAIDAVLAGRPQRFEAQFRHLASGALRSGEIHYVPDRRGDEVVGFFVLAFDITDLKAAKEAADAASVAKSAFLANMSHEIRTPLNAIIGMAAVMQRSGLEPVQAERLRKLASAGEHLLEIVNAILEMTKIDAGKVDLADEPVDVASLLSEVAAMLEPDASAKGLQVRVQVDGLPPALSGDAMRLRQALLNLYGNAIKFTDQGTITLRARALDASA
ncbi:MAG: PAS domain-containing protein, partial [Rubrivivax sp.]|nr:PAS domain-containing protein [Rubrivivax sp.]